MTRLAPADLRQAIDVYRDYLRSGGTYSLPELHECVINDAEHTLSRVTGSTPPETPPSRHHKPILRDALAEVYSELAVCCMGDTGGCLRPLPARRKAAAMLGLDLKTYVARRKPHY